MKYTKNLRIDIVNGERPLKKPWEDTLDMNDVIVLTAMMLVNQLNSGAAHLSNINLLVWRGRVVRKNANYNYRYLMRRTIQRRSIRSMSSCGVTTNHCPKASVPRYVFSSHSSSHYYSLPIMSLIYYNRSSASLHHLQHTKATSVPRRLWLNSRKT